MEKHFHFIVHRLRQTGRKIGVFYINMGLKSQVGSGFDFISLRL